MASKVRDWIVMRNFNYKLVIVTMTTVVHLLNCHRLNGSDTLHFGGVITVLLLSLEG